ncbi:efflux RND transporter periplasmic adaptor subunit [Flavobacteriaceae bacterium]|nr:efflux RND transporter periplasmic adaptor subunit [Flavobacteriaceae bacterium]
MTRILFVLLISLTVISCGDKKEQPEPVLRPVNYNQVQDLDLENSRVFTGTSRANEIINLSFRNNGIITYFNLKLGQRVKKGELLARLDNVQAKLNYESALSSQNSAASEMNTAKLNLDRVRALYEKGSSSLSDYENAKNSYLTAKGSYESSQRSVDIQKDQITYGFLYAPTNGQISSISAEINENVSSGQIVGVLNADGRKEISLGIPESVINMLTVGQKVKVTFSALPTKNYEGEVTEVAPAVDINTATYPVKIGMIGSTSDIRSGMSASVEFNFDPDQDKSQGVLGVPSTSVGEDHKGNFVFLLTDVSENSAVVKKTEVVIGSIQSNGFEIKSGLKKGDLVVTAGLQTLLDGQKVKLAKQ